MSSAMTLMSGTESGTPKIPRSRYTQNAATATMTTTISGTHIRFMTPVTKATSPHRLKPIEPLMTGSDVAGTLLFSTCSIDASHPFAGRNSRTTNPQQQCLLPYAPRRASGDRGAAHQFSVCCPPVRRRPCDRGHDVTTEGLADGGVAIRRRRAVDISVADRVACHHGHPAPTEQAPAAQPAGPRLDQSLSLGQRPAGSAVYQPAVYRRPLLDAVFGVVHTFPSAGRALARPIALAHRRIDGTRRCYVPQRGPAVSGDPAPPGAGKDGARPRYRGQLLHGRDNGGACLSHCPALAMVLSGNTGGCLHRAADRPRKLHRDRTFRGDLYRALLLPDGAGGAAQGCRQVTPPSTTR